MKKDGEVPWFLMYQPVDFKIGNFYCKKEELIDLCKIAKENNIKVIVDVVLNHVAGLENGMLLPHEKVRIRNSDFYKEAVTVENWNDRNENINKCIGLPCLKLENLELQDMIIDFLNSLIKCGVGGFRFDAGKHIKLPNEGSLFWERVLNSLDEKELFNYAEVIFESTEIIFEYLKYVKVLTEKRDIESNDIVAFVESHDSYLEFGYTKELSDEDIINKYKELCDGHKNTLFYARPFNNTWESEEIRKINKKEDIEIYHTYREYVS